jgi:glycosyltransferase involved in cell wall biosynthesis
MRVLFISQTFPYPPDSGSRNIIYHWLQALSGTDRVKLLVAEPAEGHEGTIPGLANVGFECLRATPSLGLKDRVARLAKSILQGVPATAIDGVAAVARVLAAKRDLSAWYDVIILPDNASAGYARVLAKSVPVVLYKHSVQAMDARDDRRRKGMFHPRWLLEEWIVRRFEEQTCRAATVICAVTQEDAEELSRRYKLTKPIHVVPIGVERETFLPRSNDPDNHVIGFFGNLTWGANVDAVYWFAQRVMPKVWQAFPDAEFRAIGDGGDALRAAVPDSRVVFTGRVPQTHLRDALKDVAVGVVPVISGTGTRFKLLELLSMGMPTVTTSLGKMGTRCVHQEHVLVADQPESFADAVIALLSDASLRQRLSRQAIMLSREYTWENIFERLTILLNEIIRETGAASP